MKQDALQHPDFKTAWARHWRLIPVIPATQEQRSGGSQFEASPGKIVLETLSQKKPNTHTHTRVVD
jgi:hypothetical protein